MPTDFYPLRVFLLTLSGFMNRHQADVIAYMVEENRILKEQTNGRRVRLTDDQRRRLATKAKVLGRRTLNRVATIVTPDTLMRWHRRLSMLEVGLLSTDARSIAARSPGAEVTRIGFRQRRPSYSRAWVRPRIGVGFCPDSV